MSSVLDLRCETQEASRGSLPCYGENQGPVVREMQQRVRSIRRQSESAKTSDLLPEAFVRFWAVYPLRVGKGAALKAWEKLNPPIDVVVAALRWQVGQPQWTRDGGQYIPHAATWLNQRRWEDEAFHPPQDLTPDKSDGYGTRAMKIVMGARAARGELPGQQLTPDEQHQKLLEAAFASSAAIAKGRL